MFRWNINENLPLYYSVFIKARLTEYYGTIKKNLSFNIIEIKVINFEEIYLKKI